MDNEVLAAGDGGFIGLRSRVNPLTLPDGFVQRSENMRLDRAVAQTRRGAKRLADNIALSSTPLTLPFTFGTDVAVASITRSGGTATVTTSAVHGYTTGDVVNIRGAGQSEYNIDGTITVTGATTFTYAVTGTPTTPATGTIVANESPVMRSVYTGGVFAAGIYSSPRLDNAVEYIVLVSLDKVYLWRDGSGLITKSFPASPIVETVLAGDAVTVLQAYDRVYLFRDRNEAEVAVASITQAAGTATATTSAAHGYATGEVVRMTGADQAGYNAEFLITVTGATTFTFAVPSGTVTPATVTAPLVLRARRVCVPLYWDGSTGTDFVRSPVGSHPTGVTFSRLRSSAVVAFFNGQVVEMIGRDEFGVSDILDPDTLDPVLKSFRANVGSNDYGVAVHPYQDRALLVMMRKSIYLATINIASDGVSIDAASSGVQILTNEIGCAARRSVVTAGDSVMFLSDAGVYRLRAELDLRLRGDTRPLSDDIADVMDTINVQAVHLSNAVFFNNRYWLAVPTVLENGEASTQPNTLLVYNMLNEAWESVDKYSFTLDQLVVSDYGTSRRLYVASRAGKLFLLDELQTGRDDQTSGSGYDVVPGRLVTRRYGFGSLTQKRVLRSITSAVIPQNGGLQVYASTIDPDATALVASVSNAGADEDYTIKGAIGRKCNFVEVDFRSTDGRPVIRATSVEASVPARPGSSRTES